MTRATGIRVLAVVAALSTLAATLVLGEPSRPATANVVRPIVTVQALCTAPTIIDVAAGEPTRALTAIDGLLGIDEPLILEAARDVSIVETDTGTFFVRIHDGELRLAILRPTGLPALAPDPGDGQPQTYRSFELSADMADQETTVVGGDNEVYVLFGGTDAAVAAIRLDVSTLTSDTASLSAARAPDGVELPGPASRPGVAVAHAQVLWVVSDDGTLWTYDPAADAADRWAELAGDLDGPLIASDEDLVYGVFATGDGDVELRGYATPESDAVVAAVGERDLAVEAASYPSSVEPGFLVRGAGDGGERAGVLRPEAENARLTWTEGQHATAPAIGLLANDEAIAVLTDDGSTLTYEILDEDGGHAGSFTRQDDEADCVTTEGWPDAGSVVRPMSAGSLVHLHDPGSQFDCIVDTREGRLHEVEALCAPDGPWSLDKGQAPDSDFTVEIERALEELFQDEMGDEDVPELPPERPEDEPERLGDELAEAGLTILEVDEELTDVCAEEEVTSVVAPDLEALETVGDRAIRVDWSWSGGRCLPQGYVIDVCMLAPDDGECSERRSVEVIDPQTGSNRFSHEVSTRPGRTYRVSITAFKYSVSSNPSNTLLVTTPPTIPDPPHDVSASLSQSGVWTVSWASCLDGRNCDQRPEGFVVTIEGCDGDSLSTQTHALGATDRSVSYDISGDGFRGTPLLGRNVRFRVASTGAGHSSENVVANACTESVRPGRNTSIQDTDISLGLSGRTTSMTLEGPARSDSLTRLFGIASYDDVSARLIRSGWSSSARNGALGSSVTFDVPRCDLDGWTVELTPRRRGANLTNHVSRISGVAAACGWSVTDSTQTSASVTRNNSTTFNARVTIPGLADDVRTGKVDTVRAEVTCRDWNRATINPTPSGAQIDGDQVTFSVGTPAVFDVKGACTIAPRIEGTDGATVVPARTGLDLTPVSNDIVDRAGPLVVNALKGTVTGSYAGTGRRNNPHRVEVNVERSPLRCGGAIPSADAGSSSWTIKVTGGRNNSCSGDAHRMRFERQDLDRGRATVTYTVTLGSRTVSHQESTNICALPGGNPQRPCVALCPLDSSLAVTDPRCTPCPWDESIIEGDPRCIEPEPEPDPEPPDDEDDDPPDDEDDDPPDDEDDEETP